MELHLWERVRGPRDVRRTGETDQHCQRSPEANILPHYSVPPMRSSLPIATPEATEIVASPSAGISTLATPRLIGASTVVLPVTSTLLKVTTVPSGTALPLQSRTGSV